MSLPEKIDFINLKAQQQLIRSSLDKRIQQVLAHGQYIMEPEVE
jgi:UDP-2-acetamido-2-deoxy-ribo-hexuluronate aminotransferase